MLHIQVRVVSVDHDGFTGRDNHPEDWMIGKLVTCHKLESFVGDGIEEFDPKNTDQNHNEAWTVLYGTVDDTGDPVVLIDFEVEFVRPATVRF